MKSKPSPISSVSKDEIGQTVTLEGRAQSRKNGTTLVGESFEVWLLDEDILPDDYFGDDHTGPLIRVRGTLEEDYNLPVFIDSSTTHNLEMTDPLETSTSDEFPAGPQPNSEPAIQGMPVPLGTDLEAARHRFVLRDSTYLGLVK